MLDNCRHIRLLTCLQTILELEDAVMQLPLGKDIAPEISQIKEMVGRVRDIPVSESDVIRIEDATRSFLEEIREPLQLSGVGILGRDLVQ
ncbi:MAG: hypothetical protein ACLFSY_07555 [Desulfonatronovibrionaceae bacterium]